MGNLPIGQGLSVTPMQMVAGYTAIANGGILRPPQLIETVGDEAVHEPKGHRVISAEVAAEVREMLEGVLGAGRHRLGGQRPRLHARRQDRNRAGRRKRRPTRKPSTSPRSSASRRPQDPQLLVAVIVDEPQGEIYGGSVAAPGLRQDRRVRAALPRRPAGIGRRARRLPRPRIGRR